MARQGTGAAIVGVGHTDYRALYEDRDTERDAFSLAAEALERALADCGLRKDDLDGLICSRIEYARLANVLGMHNPRFVHDLEASGRMSGVALQEAVAVVSSGLASVVACVYGNNGRSAKMKYGGEDSSATAAYESMYGMTSPGAHSAMMYRRYRHLYDAPEDALLPLALNNRRNALRNPVAVFQKELTRDEYFGARYIAEPLRLFDYCIINDGGVAFIVTSTERARDLPHPVVEVAATAGIGELRNYYASEDFFYSACQDVAGRLYETSGIGPDAVDCLQVYDNFLPTILFSLEGFGYAPRGEAWRLVAEPGRLGLDGSMPLNTSGSHTSESYMQGWALHVEAVRQLRHECGSRQVKDCKVVQYMCASPIITSHMLVAS